MTVRQLAVTARWTAAARARESARPDRLFHDPYAAALAGDDGHRLLESMERASGGAENPYLAIRTRFFDDAALARLTTAGPCQVVSVAAGLDTRPYRCAWPEGTVVYEVDQPDPLTWKGTVLSTLGAVSGCRLRTVRTDLRGSWHTELGAAGFDASVPTLWLIEGLLVYLDHAHVETLLAQVSALSSAGSLLVTDAVNSALYDQPWAQPQLRLLEHLGMPWRSHIDDPVAFLARYGWSARVRLPGTADVAGGKRWPYPVPPHGAPGQARLFMIDAVRQHSGAPVDLPHT
ncbi:SAM-dependent methyltransferase [Streptomyces sp. HC44]|uniref:S-adenosyl-L-methionine-dependent methyltransferase n=1 Tax=Streptomyces scabichelini TaxID=2711217 RepID=A0A6G4UZC1_9ACTN|nr:SAM-dependent methyltransferase [Streptomyces scabichelini]NGO07017.1 SAM-dependent methyltransferase [Streptomyces scabichelini]